MLKCPYPFLIGVNGITTTILMKVMNVGISGLNVVNKILWSLSKEILVTHIISKVCNRLTKDEAEIVCFDLDYFFDNIFFLLPVLLKL